MANTMEIYMDRYCKIKISIQVVVVLGTRSSINFASIFTNRSNTIVPNKKEKEDSSQPTINQQQLDRTNGILKSPAYVPRPTTVHRTSSHSTTLARTLEEARWSGSRGSTWFHTARDRSRRVWPASSYDRDWNRRERFLAAKPSSSSKAGKRETATSSGDGVREVTLSGPVLVPADTRHTRNETVHRLGTDSRLRSPARSRSLAREPRQSSLL